MEIWIDSRLLLLEIEFLTILSREKVLLWGLGRGGNYRHIISDSLGHGLAAYMDVP